MLVYQRVTQQKNACPSVLGLNFPNISLSLPSLSPSLSIAISYETTPRSIYTHMKGVPWNKETSYISVYINKYDNMCKKTI